MNKEEGFEIGPQHKKDSAFTARMRFHQSWYRANILRVPFGTGPGPNHSNKYGNMLTKEDGEKGLNFLTPEIFEVAKKRMEDEHGMVERFRLLNNMLSSQPMCCNLFGSMVKDYELAKSVFNEIVPGGVKKIVNVKIEHVPEPASEYLDDRTAFDAFVDFIGKDNQRKFVGIETKLTEPFSQKGYDRAAYRRWSNRDDSPWLKEAWPKLATKRYNQLWRDHLLSVAMTQHPESPYSCGFLMLVYHPGDIQCTETKDVYQTLLKPDEKSFLGYPLDKLIKTIELHLDGEYQHNWIEAFKKRYINLMYSENEFKQYECT